VIVRGDTNSTLAAALTAKKLHIPVAHIEAGERSYDRRMPEEINRIVVDSMADILYCVSEDAVRHLALGGDLRTRISSGRCDAGRPAPDSRHCSWINPPFWSAWITGWVSTAW
jgi:hypothetical protein